MLEKLEENKSDTHHPKSPLAAISAVPEISLPGPVFFHLFPRERAQEKIAVEKAQALRSQTSLDFKKEGAFCVCLLVVMLVNGFPSSCCPY